MFKKSFNPEQELLIDIFFDIYSHIQIYIKQIF